MPDVDVIWCDLILHSPFLNFFFFLMSITLQKYLLSCPVTLISQNIHVCYEYYNYHTDITSPLCITPYLNHIIAVLITHNTNISHLYHVILLFITSHLNHTISHPHHSYHTDITPTSRHITSYDITTIHIHITPSTSHR